MAGHASSVFRSSRRPAGYAGSPSNNSFTLPTPPAHRAPEDSARPGLPASPREISLVTATRSLRTFLVALVLVLSAVASLSFASAGRRGDASAARRCSPTGTTTGASTSSTRSTATRRRSTRSRTTSVRTSTPRTSSPARSRARCAASSTPVGATRLPTARRTTARPGRQRQRRERHERERRAGDGDAARSGQRPDVDTSGPVVRADPTARARRACRSRSLPQAASDTSRDVARPRTPTTSATTTRSSEASLTDGGKAIPGRMSVWSV